VTLGGEDAFQRGVEWDGREPHVGIVRAAQFGDHAFSHSGREEKAVEIADRSEAQR